MVRGRAPFLGADRMTATVAADLRAIEGLAAGLGERAVDLAHNNVKGDA